jgi:hypothetical protein
VPSPRFLVDELSAHVQGKGPQDLVFAGVRGGGALRSQVFRRACFDQAAASMTLDQYGHLFGDRLDEVADAMDAARLATSG